LAEQNKGSADLKHVPAEVEEGSVDLNHVLAEEERSSGEREEGWVDLDTRPAGPEHGPAEP
jgi:hypothetical protein